MEGCAVLSHRHPAHQDRGRASILACMRVMVNVTMVEESHNTLLAHRARTASTAAPGSTACSRTRRPTLRVPSHGEARCLLRRLRRRLARQGPGPVSIPAYTQMMAPAMTAATAFSTLCARRVLTAMTAARGLAASSTRRPRHRPALRASAKGAGLPAMEGWKSMILAAS